MEGLGDEGDGGGYEGGAEGSGGGLVDGWWGWGIQ